VRSSARMHSRPARTIGGDWNGDRAVGIEHNPLRGVPGSALRCWRSGGRSDQKTEKLPKSKVRVSGHCLNCGKLEIDKNQNVRRPA